MHVRTSHGCSWYASYNTIMLMTLTYMYLCVALLHGYMGYIYFVSLSNLLHNMTEYVHTCDITCNAGCPSLYEMQYSNCGSLGGSAEGEL